MARIAFMGTPEFAKASLAALCAAGHIPVAVYTQPPRPAGRGQNLQPSPVQIYAEAQGIPVRYPKSLRDPIAQQEFAALNLDVAIVAAYGLILPPAILSAPRLGCINIHGSLLPRWRGAAPIQRAILAGDNESGIGLMQMEAGLDTGPVLAEARCAITSDMNAGELHDTLMHLGAKLLIENLAAILSGALTPRPQPPQGVTYAAKIEKAEAKIDWQRPAIEIARQIRAFAPVPGAYFEYGGERIKILRATTDSGSMLTPGQIARDPLRIGCGVGAIIPLQLQRAGKKAQSVDEFLRGFDFTLSPLVS
jgi:methionyl-tRNA formyltransferase